MKEFSVKQVAKLSGVSIKTLHHYDKIDLLKPLKRNPAGYRKYGENELLKLQQILFYKKLEFSLSEIKEILNDPNFDLLTSLENQKTKLKEQQEKFSILIKTIDETIINITKGSVMKNIKKLYKGISEDKAIEFHKEALEKWPEQTVKATQKLEKLPQKDFDTLIKDFDTCWRKLAALVGSNPSSQKVQDEIANHYNLIRQLWGTEKSKDSQKNQYQGLGELYIADPRYTEIDGKQCSGFGEFLNKAIKVYSDKNLK